jgi:polysaccharide export outer membrane protein
MAQKNGQQRDENQYRIGPEDVLEVVVWKNQEVSRKVPVRPDGMISLPLLNDVKAAGFTPMQLRDILIKQLEEYIPNAEVSVIVTEIHSPKVSVLGETTAGRYVLRNRTTVLDFLAQVGGLKEFAAPSRIVILRSEGSTVKRIPFNYKKAIAANGDATEEAMNFYLEPGDIILVPKSLF